jgi:S1-C subfamily serine protease
VGVDGKPTPTLAELAQALEDTGIGKDATLRVTRGNTERDVKVRVVDLPD